MFYRKQLEKLIRRDNSIKLIKAAACHEPRRVMAILSLVILLINHTHRGEGERGKRTNWKIYVSFYIFSFFSILPSRKKIFLETHPSSRKPKPLSGRRGLSQSCPACRHKILRWTWTRDISSRPYESIISRAARWPSRTWEWDRHSSRGRGRTFLLGSHAWTWRKVRRVEWWRLKW